MLRNLVLIFMLLSALCTWATLADDQSLAGYSAEGARLEHDWENKFRDIPRADNQRDYMKRLSARPHHVGSPYDKDNAEWLLGKIKEWGLDAHIENFDVLFPTPKERVVELVEPGNSRLPCKNRRSRLIPLPTSKPNNSLRITPIRPMAMSLRLWST